MSVPNRNLQPSDFIEMQILAEEVAALREQNARTIEVVVLAADALNIVRTEYEYARAFAPRAVNPARRAGYTANVIPFPTAGELAQT